MFYQTISLVISWAMKKKWLNKKSYIYQVFSSIPWLFFDASFSFFATMDRYEPVRTTLEVCKRCCNDLQLQYRS